MHLFDDRCCSIYVGKIEIDDGVCMIGAVRVDRRSPGLIASTSMFVSWVILSSSVCSSSIVGQQNTAMASMLFLFLL
jgi:hypothetical protein